MPKRHRLILVEDDSALLSALTFAFEIEGYDVRAFRDAESVLAQSPFEGSDCLVVDQVLPGASGLEFLKRLRRDGVTTPAVLISTPTARVTALAAAQGVPFVGKPLISNALIEEVRRQIFGRNTSLL